MRRGTSPGGKKSVAKHPERNQGGRREEIYRPALASGVGRRLRNRKQLAR